MAHLDRRRAETMMAGQGIDALLLLTPESFTYATGAAPGVAAMWRRAGAFAAVIPADAGLPAGAVVTDLFEAGFRAASDITDVRINPIWVATADLRGLDLRQLSAPALVQAGLSAEGRRHGFARPETFDAAHGFQLAADILAGHRFDKTRIGVELDSLSVTDFRLLANALPDAELVDASGLVARLKMVKSAVEIDCLRLAVQLAESGIDALRERIAIGTHRDDLAAAWTAGVQREAARRGVETLTGLWEYISVGENPWTKGGIVENSSLIKVDVGCLIAGYTSDTGRTFVCGRPTSLQTSLFSALEGAYEAGLAMLQPGNPMREVHAAASAAMARAGFAGYTRGHFGHGLGAGLGSEEWPFLSRDCEILLEPGMVLAFETPWYIDGVGGMIIENQLLITPTGHEIMNRLPSGLVSV